MRITKRMKHLARYRQIAVALVHHGFSLFADEVGLSRFYPRSSQRPLKEKTDFLTSTGQRLRRVLEELGPTFVKLGQIASTRPDLLPKEFIHELEMLQDNVSPFSFDEVKEIVGEELGDVNHIFQTFEERPIAAASIGQVHKATLLSGEEVAVKVQRPRIEKEIEVDLDILLDLAITAEKRLDWAKKYQLRELVEEFSRSIKEELDYTIEGGNAEKIAGNGSPSENGKKYVIPKVFWDYTTRKVLTMEFVEGIKLDRPEKLTESGYDPKRVAEELAEAMFHQIFAQGYFHGDPHPGNLLLTKSGQIGFVDFGLIGRLTQEMKQDFAALLIAITRKHTEGIIRVLSRLGLLPDEVRMGELRRDIHRMMDKYYEIPIGEIRVGESIGDLFEIVQRHHIRLPTDLTVLGKSLITVEGIILKLNPGVSLIDMAEPYGRRFLADRYRPDTLMRTLWNLLNDYGDLAVDLPKQIQEFTQVASKGKIGISLEEQTLSKAEKILKTNTNRLSLALLALSLSILLSGLIIGLSIAGSSPFLWSYPLVEGISLFFLLLLIISIIKIWRSQKK